MPKAFKQLAPTVPNRHHAKNAIIMVAIYELVKGLVALGVAAIIFVGHDKLQWIARVVSQALHRIMGMALHHQIEALNHYAWVANQNWQKPLNKRHLRSVNPVLVILIFLWGSLVNWSKKVF